MKFSKAQIVALIAASPRTAMLNFDGLPPEGTGQLVDSTSMLKGAARRLRAQRGRRGAVQSYVVPASGACERRIPWPAGAVKRS